MDKQIKDKSYIVYKRQLKNDNRVYIGYTKLSLHERAGRNGRKYANCEKFFDAILEYGWDNFESQILKENLSKKEAIYWESFYIQQYNSIQNGFNTDNGTFHSEETRRKMSEAHQKSAVRCVETGIIYNSIKEAGEKLNIKTYNHISDVCKGRRQTCGGFHWEYFKKEDN